MVTIFIIIPRIVLALFYKVRKELLSGGHVCPPVYDLISVPDISVGEVISNSIWETLIKSRRLL
jgi:hypothetical protein